VAFVETVSWKTVWNPVLDRSSEDESPSSKVDPAWDTLRQQVVNRISARSSVHADS